MRDERKHKTPHTSRGTNRVNSIGKDKANHNCLVKATAKYL